MRRARRGRASPQPEGCLLLDPRREAVLPAGVAWALGELSQNPGTAGCVSETGTGGACQNGKALQAAIGVAASSDGQSLYVASSSSDAVAVFDRDPLSGALTQKGARLPASQKTALVAAARTASVSDAKRDATQCGAHAEQRRTPVTPRRPADPHCHAWAHPRTCEGQCADEHRMATGVSVA